MRRIRTGIFLINALLLKNATSFRQITHISFSRRLHSGCKLQSGSTTIQWVPKKSLTFVGIPRGNMIETKSVVRASASSKSTIDVRPDSERIVSTVCHSVLKLCSSGSDIRGRFVDHDESIHSLVEATQDSEAISSQPCLTPFAAYCIGYSFANTIIKSLSESTQATICIGVDPRTHGIRLAEAFACGVGSYLTSDTKNCGSLTTVFTGAATTPACASFVRSQQCDGAVVRQRFRFSNREAKQ